MSQAGQGSKSLSIGMTLVSACALLGAAIACLGCATRGNGAYGSPGSPQGGSGREAYQPPAALPERFTAFAVNLGTAPGVPAGGSAIVQISIDRWSTPEERDQLVTALRQGGNQGLLAALQAAPVVGGIRTPDTVSWPLHYAHQRLDPDGSRHIFIATDRLIKWWEELYRTHSVSYPFMLIELQVDKHGSGQGRMLLASKIVANRESRRVEIESYTTEPALLENLREETGR
jgi:hypothetical protein